MANGKPDYIVSAKADANVPEKDTRYVNIGVGFDSETPNTREPCINVILNARPWGEWDGKFTLFRLRER